MELTQIEIDKTMKLCFDNPIKACAIAQIIIDTVGVVNCSTYALLKGKSKRSVQYNVDNLNGVNIENRKFPAINQ